MRKSIGLYHVKHAVELHGERSDHATLGFVLDRLWIDGWVGRMIMVIMLDYLRIASIVTMTNRGWNVHELDGWCR